MNTPAVTVTNYSVEIPAEAICSRSGQLGAICGCRRCQSESEHRFLDGLHDLEVVRAGVELIDAGIPIPRGLGEAVMQ